MDWLTFWVKFELLILGKILLCGGSALATTFSLLVEERIRLSSSSLRLLGRMGLSVAPPRFPPESPLRVIKGLRNIARLKID